MRRRKRAGRRRRTWGPEEGSGVREWVGQGRKRRGSAKKWGGKRGEADPTWRPRLSNGGPHKPGLPIGQMTKLLSPLASVSSKAKMATGLWPLVGQWPPPGKACAGAVAPRGEGEGEGGGGERMRKEEKERRGRWRWNFAWLRWDRGEVDDTVRYVDVDRNEDDDEEERNDWTGGSIFTKLSLLAPSTTIYLHLIPRRSSRRWSYLNAAIMP